MFSTTLKDLNLFVLPKPKFNIPSSELDPIHRIRLRAGDPDTSHFTRNHMEEWGSTEMPTSLGIHPEARRNTIAFPCTIKDGLPTFWREAAQKDVPGSLDHSEMTNIHHPSRAKALDPRLDRPFNSIMHTRSSESIKSSAGPKVRIVTPANTPSSMRRRLREDLSLYDCSPAREKAQQSKALNKRRESVSIFAGLSRKNKEKRNSAPPLLSYNTNVETATPFQTTVAEGHESVSPTRLPPSLVHKYQGSRVRTHTDLKSNSSYPSKLFELDLSPIIEDAYIFADHTQQESDRPGFHDPEEEDSPLESSSSSYGEILNHKKVDYFCLSGYGFFGDLSRPANDDKQESDYGWPMQQQSEDLTDQQGLNMFRACAEPQGIETHASDVIPELVLTLPTPEIRSSGEFSCWHPNIGYAQTSEARSRSIADDWNSRQEDDEICDEVLHDVKSPSSSQSSLNDCAEVRNEPRCSTGTEAFTPLVSRSATGNCPSNDDVPQCYSELVSPMSPIVFANMDSQNWSASPPDLGRQTGRQQVTATFRRLGATFSRLSRFVLGDVKRSDSVSTKQKNVPSMQNFLGRKAWHLKRLSRILSPAQSNLDSDMSCEEPDRRNTSVSGDPSDNIGKKCTSRRPRSAKP